MTLQCVHQQIGEYMARLGSFEKEMAGLKPLHDAHFLEIEQRRDPLLEPKIDYPMYRAMEAHGDFALFVLVASDGALVGNMGFRLMTHPIHGRLVAAEEFLYLTPAHRKGMLAFRFVRWIMEVLRQGAVYEIVTGFSPYTNLGPFYRRLGFSPRSFIYSRTL